MHFSGLTRAQVVDAVGDCCLAEEPARWLTWPAARYGAVLFRDDDLMCQPASCDCYRTYLTVLRRVPREMWRLLIPVTITEIEGIRAAGQQAPSDHTSRFLAAELAVTSLTSTRPFVEHSPTVPPASAVPDICRACCSAA